MSDLSGPTEVPILRPISVVLLRCPSSTSSVCHCGVLRSTFGSLFVLELRLGFTTITYPHHSPGQAMRLTGWAFQPIQGPHHSPGEAMLRLTVWAFQTIQGVKSKYSTTSVSLGCLNKAFKSQEFGQQVRSLFRWLPSSSVSLPIPLRTAQADKKSSVLKFCQDVAEDSTIQVVRPWATASEVEEEMR
eukprot:scaffold131148_cov40-Cyclotella_meneghiniana.AAC.1